MDAPTPSLILCDKDRDSLAAAALLLPREEEKLEVHCLAEHRLLEDVWPELLGPYRHVTLAGLGPEVSVETVRERCKDAEKVAWFSSKAHGFTPAIVREYRAVAPNLRIYLAEEKGALPVADLALKDRKSTRLNSSHIQKSRMPSSA